MMCEGSYEAMPFQHPHRPGRVVSDDAALVRMMPPWYEDKKEPSLNAPIANWEIVGSYDSAHAYTNELLKIVTPARARETAKERRAFGVKCISTDDPRLKGD
jgi:hypothetical protein